MALDPKFLTCSRCGRKPPESTSFTCGTDGTLCVYCDRDNLREKLSASQTEIEIRDCKIATRDSIIGGRGTELRHAENEKNEAQRTIRDLKCTLEKIAALPPSSLFQAPHLAKDRLSMLEPEAPAPKKDCQHEWEPDGDRDVCRLCGCRANPVM